MLFQGGVTAVPGICGGLVYTLTATACAKSIPRGSILVCEIPPSLVSFCLISQEYFTVTIRFCFYFYFLDCLCGENPGENYVLMRFAGGGGNGIGKDLRLVFLANVLKQLNFTFELTGELLDARLMRYGKQITADRLDQVGRGCLVLCDFLTWYLPTKAWWRI